jgi:hypothetical protein
MYNFVCEKRSFCMVQHEDAEEHEVNDLDCSATGYITPSDHAGGACCSVFMAGVKKTGKHE